jgi:hypothetical protein
MERTIDHYYLVRGLRQLGNQLYFLNETLVYSVYRLNYKWTVTPCCIAL